MSNYHAGNISTTPGEQADPPSQSNLNQLIPPATPSLRLQRGVSTLTPSKAFLSGYPKG